MRYFQRLPMRQRRWVENGEPGGGFFIHPGDVEALFQMGPVFAQMMGRHFSTSVLLRRNCESRRCLKNHCCLVPLLDILRNTIEVDFVYPARLIESWRTCLLVFANV